MPKYMIVATYTAEGIKGVLREGGSARRALIADIAKNLGGSLESFYYAFGENDVYSVVDLPDDDRRRHGDEHLRGGHGAGRGQGPAHARGDRQVRQDRDVVPAARDVSGARRIA